MLRIKTSNQLTIFPNAFVRKQSSYLHTSHHEYRGKLECVHIIVLYIMHDLVCSCISICYGERDKYEHNSVVNIQNNTSMVMNLTERKGR